MVVGRPVAVSVGEAVGAEYDMEVGSMTIVVGSQLSVLGTVAVGLMLVTAASEVGVVGTALVVGIITTGVEDVEVGRSMTVEFTRGMDVALAVSVGGTTEVKFVTGTPVGIEVGADVTGGRDVGLPVSVEDSVAVELTTGISVDELDEIGGRIVMIGPDEVEVVFGVTSDEVEVSPPIGSSDDKGGRIWVGVSVLVF